MSLVGDRWLPQSQRVSATVCALTAVGMGKASCGGMILMREREGASTQAVLASCSILRSWGES